MKLMVNRLHNSFEIWEDNIIAKNYLNLDLSEKERILEFRNHPLVRSKMVNNEKILKKDHFSFLEGLKSKPEGHWILQKDNYIYGTLNLTGYVERTDSFMGGNYSNPKLIGTGIGLALNFVLHKIAFEEIECKGMRAIIQKNNKNAVRLNQLFGGSLIRQFEIGKNSYLEMFFERENWSEIKENTEKYLKYVF